MALALVMLLFSTQASYAEVIAKVANVVGSVLIETPDGKKSFAKKDMTLEEKTWVKTTTQGWVRLLMKDGTQVRLNPGSILQLLQNPAENPGLLRLDQGRLRAQVKKPKSLKTRKDWEAEKNKLYLKTPTATLGVRGTDFTLTYHPKNQVSTVVTYHGQVAMVKSGKASTLKSNLSGLENELNDSQTALVGPGQFSSVVPKFDEALEPLRISPVQLFALQKSDSPAARIGITAEKYDSTVPSGLNPKQMAVSAAALNKQINQLGISSNQLAEAKAAAKTGEGGYVDLKSGLYIPPPANSAVDSNTGLAMPPSNYGSVDINSGEYLPPAGYSLDPEKGLVAEEGGDKDGKIPEGYGAPGFVAESENLGLGFTDLSPKENFEFPDETFCQKCIDDNVGGTGVLFNISVQ